MGATNTPQLPHHNNHFYIKVRKGEALKVQHLYVVLFAFKVPRVTSLHAPLPGAFAAPSALPEQHVTIPTDPCSLQLQALSSEKAGCENKEQPSHQGHVRKYK